MEFVDFNLAKKLKERGFKDKVNAYYGKHEKLFDVHPALNMNDADYRASAPTISQVLKWLREEKKTHIVIDFDSDMNWYYQIAPYGLTTYEKESNHKYKSYEKATLAGIEYVLDNLI